MNAYRGASTSWTLFMDTKMVVCRCMRRTMWTRETLALHIRHCAHTATIRRPNQFDWWNGTDSMAMCVIALPHLLVVAIFFSIRSAHSRYDAWRSSIWIGSFARATCGRTTSFKMSSLFFVVQLCECVATARVECVQLSESDAKQTLMQIKQFVCCLTRSEKNRIENEYSMRGPSRLHPKMRHFYYAFVRHSSPR